MRARRLAEDAIDAADQRAAAAVRVLATSGLTQPEIAAARTVPLWTVRRLLTLASPIPPQTAATSPGGGLPPEETS